MAKKKSTKVAAPAFSITLSLSGKTYIGSGSTVLDALTNLERPAKIMGKGILTVTDGKITQTHTLWNRRLKLFFRPIALPYQAKNLAHAFSA